MQIAGTKNGDTHGSTCKVKNGNCDYIIRLAISHYAHHQEEQGEGNTLRMGRSARRRPTSIRPPVVKGATCVGVNKTWKWGPNLWLKDPISEEWANTTDVQYQIYRKCNGQVTEVGRCQVWSLTWSLISTIHASVELNRQVFGRESWIRSKFLKTRFL